MRKLILLAAMLSVIFSGCVREHVSDEKLNHVKDVKEKDTHSREEPLRKEDLGSSMF